MAVKPSLKCRERNIMKIHPLNYEAYAMDYLEGSLSSEDQRAFERFLEDHPETAVELKAMKLMYAEPDTGVTFANKESLKQPVQQAQTFMLPGWAIAASWALVIASFAFWLSSAFDPQLANEAFVEHKTSLEASTILKAEIAQTLPVSNQKKTAKISKYTTEWNIAAEPDWNAVVYGLPNEQTELLQEKKPAGSIVLTQLPAPRLKADISSNQTQIIFYKPWKGYKRNIKVNDRIDQIAMMDPIKRISPKRYLSIRDFNIVDEVFKDIDGEQIANAITPEIIK